MARKKTETTVEAPKKPDFSFRRTDGNLYFEVKVYGDKLAVEGVDASQIKTEEGLNRYLRLVGEIIEAIDSQNEYNSDMKDCFESCNNDCTEGFCGPCYCAN